MQRTGKPAPRRRPRPLQMGGNPRLVAINTLQDVTRAGAYASIALSARLRDSNLEKRDKDLATELVYGTLERKIALDYLIDQRLSQPDIDALVRDILRMGAYQIVYLTRIPDRAAVDESVKLTRGLDREAFVGLVNGVLRGISRESEAGALGWPNREENPARYFSILHSVPEWLARRLIAAYGEAEAEATLAYRPEEKSVTVRLTPESEPAQAFEKRMTARGWQFTKARLEGVYYVSGIGDVGIDKAYLEGIYSVQAESSMLAAMAVAPKRAGMVLDACAAPGGKTACLSALMSGTGRVYAWDKHEHRVELLKSMVQRLRLYNVRPAVRDASIVREDMLMTMDAVLIDAPCSGLGVMLAKPDVKYRHTEESIASLVAAQKALLDACCQYVKPGGTLVYATCTILPEENEEQIRAFLSAHPEFEPDGEGLRAAMPEFLQGRVDGCMLRLRAHIDQMEGFFIARMKRRKA